MDYHIVDAASSAKMKPLQTLLFILHLKPFEYSSLNILLEADAAAELVNGLNSDHPPQHILVSAVR